MDYALLLLALGDEEMEGYTEIRDTYFSSDDWEDRGEYYLHKVEQLSTKWADVRSQLIITVSGFSSVIGRNPFKSRHQLLVETVNRIYEGLNNLRLGRHPSVLEKYNVPPAILPIVGIFPIKICAGQVIHTIDYPPSTTSSSSSLSSSSSSSLSSTTISSSTSSSSSSSSSSKTTPLEEDIERGIRLEPHIRNYFGSFFKRKVRSVGIAIPKYNLSIGASTDAEIYECISGTDPSEIIEIKAPRKTPVPILRFVDDISRGKKRNPGDTSHIWDSHVVQMQSCMKILHKRRCNYVSYCENERFLFVDRIDHDEEESAMIYKRVRDFVEEVKKAVFENEGCNKLVRETIKNLGRLRGAKEELIREGESTKVSQVGPIGEEKETPSKSLPLETLDSEASPQKMEVKHSPPMRQYRKKEPKKDSNTLMIRHGDKKYENTKGPEGSPLFDPDLLEGQQEKIETLARSLGRRGRPEFIFTSPYLRTRRTAEIIGKVLGVEVKVDRLLGDYLGNQWKILSDKDVKLSECFEEETIIHNPITLERMGEFKKRCREYQFKENTWYVTHGYIMYTITGVKEISTLEVLAA